MDEKKVWQMFERTGNIEWYELYHTIKEVKQKKKKS